VTSTGLSIGDLVIISAGLLAGWWIVSFIFRESATGTLRKLGDRELSDEQIREGWPTILAVSPSASAEEIEAACGKRLDALRQSFPAVMTDVEARQFDRGSDLLRRARALGEAEV
jgi:hypothetical protein